MSGQPLADAQAAAIKLIESLDFQRNRAAVVSFSDAARVEQRLSDDQDALTAAVQQLSVRKGTDIAAGISSAQHELGRSARSGEVSQIIVILSDGNSDVNSAIAAAAQAREASVRIISIGLGAAANTALLQSLVADPGDYYYAPTSADLPAIYQAIGRELSCATASS